MASLWRFSARSSPTAQSGLRSSPFLSQLSHITRRNIQALQGLAPSMKHREEKVLRPVEAIAEALAKALENLRQRQVLCPTPRAIRCWGTAHQASTPFTSSRLKIRDPKTWALFPTHRFRVHLLAQLSVAIEGCSKISLSLKDCIFGLDSGYHRQRQEIVSFIV